MAIDLMFERDGESYRVMTVSRDSHDNLTIAVNENSPRPLSAMANYLAGIVQSRESLPFQDSYVGQENVNYLEALRDIAEEHAHTLGYTFRCMNQ